MKKAGLIVAVTAVIVSVAAGDSWADALDPFSADELGDGTISGYCQANPDSEMCQDWCSDHPDVCEQEDEEGSCKGEETEST